MLLILPWLVVWSNIVHVMSRMVEVIIVLDHAGGGDWLVEAGEVTSGETRSCYSHPHMRPVTSVCSGVYSVSVIVTVSGAHTGTPVSSPTWPHCWPPASTPLTRGHHWSSPTWPRSLSSVCVRSIVHSVHLVTTVYLGEAGAGGAESGLDCLLVSVGAWTQVTLPHPLDRILNIRQLTYLCFWKYKQQLKLSHWQLFQLCKIYKNFLIGEML